MFNREFRKYKKAYKKYVKGEYIKSHIAEEMADVRSLVCLDQKVGEEENGKIERFASEI